MSKTKTTVIAALAFVAGGILAIAQQANEYDMNGHAAKAKELLEQANAQLRQAATAANQNKK
jgi:hypothetical protein